MQDVLLCDLDGAALPELERMLDEHGIPRPEQRSNVRKLQHGLPGDPDVRPGPLRGGAVAAGHHRRAGSRAEATGAGKRDDLSVRMTGCPNGCVRPYQSDIGIVGRSGDKYVALRRRPRPRPPPQLRVAGPGSAARHRAGAAGAAGPLQTGARRPVNRSATTACAWDRSACRRC